MRCGGIDRKNTRGQTRASMQLRGTGRNFTDFSPDTGVSPEQGGLPRQLGIKYFPWLWLVERSRCANKDTHKHTRARIRTTPRERERERNLIFFIASLKTRKKKNTSQGEKKKSHRQMCPSASRVPLKAFGFACRSVLAVSIGNRAAVPRPIAGTHDWPIPRNDQSSCRRRGRGRGERKRLDFYDVRVRQ